MIEYTPSQICDDGAYVVQISVPKGGDQQSTSTRYNLLVGGMHALAH